MARKTPTTLVGPDGRDFTTSDRAEVTNLEARGWKVRSDVEAVADAAPKPAPKPTK